MQKPTSIIMPKSEPYDGQTFISLLVVRVLWRNGFILELLWQLLPVLSIAISFELLSAGSIVCSGVDLPHHGIIMAATSRVDHTNFI